MTHKFYLGVFLQARYVIKEKGMEYDDNYATCEDTSVTLRIFADEIMPQEITERLGSEPSFIQVKGERKYPNRPEYINKENGWFLNSENSVKSKDSRRHLAWLISKLSNKHEEIKSLAANGAEIDIFCPWESKSGQGGPTMDPSQMKTLGELNIELVFEFWYCEEKE